MPDASPCHLMPKCSANISRQRMPKRLAPSLVGPISACNRALRLSLESAAKAVPQLHKSKSTFESKSSFESESSLGGCPKTSGAWRVVMGVLRGSVD